MLLERDRLLPRLRVRLASAIRVDLAMAWVGQGQALDALSDFAERHPGGLRCIVGISGNATHPVALRALAGKGELRLPLNNPMFHAKAIIFHEEAHQYVWIGSANLTRSGFEQNEELTVELQDNQEAIKWFSELWNNLNPDCETTIERYCNNWEPPLALKGFIPFDDQVPDLSRFKSLKNNIGNWNSFASAINKADIYWSKRLGYSVTGENASWLNTITRGHEVALRPIWDDLSYDDYRLIVGREKKSKLDGYGLLGSMIGAGIVNNVFSSHKDENLITRRSIRKALQSPIDASAGDFSRAALEFVEKVSRIPGFGEATATRLLTLARPDLAVSVNKGSNMGLAEYSGLPPTSLGKRKYGERSKSYIDLLSFLKTQSWYASPTPVGAFENLIANNRAALLDCLVYEPVTQGV